jgi:hypothetical protein
VARDSGLDAGAPPRNDEKNNSHSRARQHVYFTSQSKRPTFSLLETGTTCLHGTYASRLLQDLLQCPIVGDLQLSPERPENEHADQIV